MRQSVCLYISVRISTDNLKPQQGDLKMLSGRESRASGGGRQRAQRTHNALDTKTTSQNARQKPVRAKGPNEDEIGDVERTAKEMKELKLTDHKAITTDHGSSSTDRSKVKGKRKKITTADKEKIDGSRSSAEKPAAADEENSTAEPTNADDISNADSQSNVARISPQPTEPPICAIDLDALIEQAHRGDQATITKLQYYYAECNKRKLSGTLPPASGAATADNPDDVTPALHGVHSNVAGISPQPTEWPKHVVDLQELYEQALNGDEVAKAQYLAKLNKLRGSLPPASGATAADNPGDVTPALHGVHSNVAGISPQPTESSTCAIDLDALIEQAHCGDQAAITKLQYYYAECNKLSGSLPPASGAAAADNSREVTVTAVAGAGGLSQANPSGSDLADKQSSQASRPPGEHPERRYRAGKSQPKAEESSQSWRDKMPYLRPWNWGKSGEKKPKRSHEDFGSDPYDSSSCDPHHHPGPMAGQMSAQQQAFRSAQATSQMVYDVFGWTVASIETLEKMENEKLLQQHDIDLSDPSRPFFETMVANNRTREEMVEQCNTYLILFKVQLGGVEAELRQQLLQQMFASAEEWSQTGLESVETLVGKKLGHASYFKQELFRVLVGEIPNMLHASLESELAAQEISSGETRCKTFFHLQQGMVKTEELDESFRNNPKKKAKMPQLRKNFYC